DSTTGPDARVNGAWARPMRASARWRLRWNVGSVFVAATGLPVIAGVAVTVTTIVRHSTRTTRNSAAWVDGVHGTGASDVSAAAAPKQQNDRAEAEDGRDGSEADQRCLGIEVDRRRGALNRLPADRAVPDDCLAVSPSVDLVASGGIGERDLAERAALAVLGDVEVDLVAVLAVVLLGDQDRRERGRGGRRERGEHQC